MSQYAIESLVAWAWMPLFLVTSMIADSFAGERERHTLETLLARFQRDRLILDEAAALNTESVGAGLRPAPTSSPSIRVGP